MNSLRLIIGLFAGALSVSQSLAIDLDVSGALGVESQMFWEEEQYADQRGGASESFVLQPEIRWRSGDGRQRVSIVGHLRVDRYDEERSHADFREAYWGYEAGTWDLVVGINKVFWGVAESRHLVDVINQTDLVEDIDQEEKVGQPMINLNLEREFGRFELYLLPGFRARTFPGAEGRLRAALPVDADDALFESGAGEDHVDLALRYSHYIGEIDIGAHAFRGTSREPAFVVSPAGDRLVPAYEQISQIGLDVQYTRDAWLLKLEAIGRDGDSGSFAAAVAGFEYTFYGVRDGGSDVGVLLEALYDGRDERAPPTPFDSDIFAGVRLALNDPADTAILAGVAVDTVTGERFLNVEAERRLASHFTAQLRARAFSRGTEGGVLDALARDDYLQVRLTWHF